MRITQILLLCLMAVSSVAEGETNRTVPADGKGVAWESPIPSDCPFPRAPSLTGLFFTGRHSDYQCGDTFYPSWASDGNLYSPWTDGKTWELSPLTPEKPLFPEPRKFLGPVKMGAPHFVDFGRNMEHSPDGKAYLARVTPSPETINDPQAYEITGPWRMATYMKNFGEQAYFLNFPSKFISPDGQSLWLCYSANFSPGWNGVKLNFNPPGGRYGLCLHEVKLLKPAAPAPNKH